MAATYTTATLVKKRINFISASLTDDDIVENIMQAESIIDSVMLKTARGSTSDFTFNSTKHGIIRSCATDLAAYFSIEFDFVEFRSMEETEMTINLLWNSAQVALTLLADVRTVSHLEGL
jgi:hypothetical protein